MTSARSFDRAFTAIVATLGAAMVRGLLVPSGTFISAAAFVVLLGLTCMWLGSPDQPSHRWPAVPSAALGLALGLALVLPLGLSSGPPSCGVRGFIGWGSGTALVATLEEVVIRGHVQNAWGAAFGVPSAMIVSALIFAAIHLPIYGVKALPVDFAVGLALAGLRVVTGRIGPCAIAHVGADFGGWFWS